MTLLWTYTLLYVIGVKSLQFRGRHDSGQAWIGWGTAHNLQRGHFQ